MSVYKKMYLVSEEDMAKYKNKSEGNPYNLVMSPYLKSASNLDEEMRNILESKIADDEKAKLYTNALQRYLIYRFKFLDPKFDSNDFPNIKSINEPIITRKKKPKKLKLKIKPKLKLKASLKKLSEMKKDKSSPEFITPTSSPTQPPLISFDDPSNELTVKSRKSTRKRKAKDIANKRIKSVVQDELKYPSWEKF